MMLNKISAIAVLFLCCFSKQSVHYTLYAIEQRIY